MTTPDQHDSNSSNRFPDIGQPIRLPSPLPQDTDDDDDENLGVSNFGTDVNIMVILFHPLHIARTLVQLGHEPLPPIPSTSIRYFLGLDKIRPLAYPWLPSLATHIYREVGLWRLFSTGLCARVVTELLMSHGDTLGRRLVCLDAGLPRNGDAGNLMETESLRKSIKHGSQMILWKAYTVLITQPLQVLMIRQFTELLVPEAAGRGLYALTKETLLEEGISGFFRGLVPRMLGECTALAGYLVMCRVSRQYVLPKKADNDSTYLSRTLCYLVSHKLSYPLMLVGVVMSCDGGARTLPDNLKFQQFGSWLSCAQTLYRAKQGLRGYFIMSRAATNK